MVTLRLGKAEKSILVEYDDYQITITGQNLTRLWRDLRVFRVKEVVVNGDVASEVAGGRDDRCRVGAIAI